MGGEAEEGKGVRALGKTFRRMLVKSEVSSLDRKCARHLETFSEKSKG